jgi:hypothetical protein
MKQSVSKTAVFDMAYRYLFNIHLLPKQVSHLNPVLQLQLPNNYLHVVPRRKGRGAQPSGLLFSAPEE